MNFFLAENNKIKDINGKVFQKLTKLAKFYMEENVCIDEGFNIPTRITAMPHIVTQKCGLNETFDQIHKKVTQETQ